MYKPGTQLIITDRWAVFAAEKLGFCVETFRHPDNSWVKGYFMFLAFTFAPAKKWRIVVTASGPNAAERFLPQLDDYVEWAGCHTRIVCADDFHPISECLIPLSFARMYSAQKGIRIIERNNIPFPQFSEVIEP